MANLSLTLRALGLAFLLAIRNQGPQIQQNSQGEEEAADSEKGHERERVVPGQAYRFHDQPVIMKMPAVLNFFAIGTTSRTFRDSTATQNYG